MARSSIIISQDPHGSSPAGVAKRGLDLYSVGSKALIFTNSSDGNIGVSKWEWTLVERPPGSSASLSGADSDTAQLQADVYGRYVVSLRVNDLGDDTLGYSEIVAGVSYPSLGTLLSGDELGDWDLPAFHEGTHANWTDFYGPLNPFGAQRELFRILKQVRENLSGGVADGVIRFPLSGALSQRTDLNVWTDAAYIKAFDMSDIAHVNAYFGATAMREGSAGTVEVRLYDVTNAVAITNSLIDTYGATPSDGESVALTVGGSSGNLRNDGATNYKVQIRITGGTPTADFVSLFDAWLRLELV